MNKLHERIRERRRELGWTREQLAERAGYAVRTIRRLERGCAVQALALLHVCQALGLDLDARARTTNN